MPATPLQHLMYRDKFRTEYTHSFEDWFHAIGHELYPNGHYQAVRLTQGDGGMDSYVINRQIVYQVFAPARNKEMRDIQTKNKIERDFKRVYLKLGDSLKTWVFVHNHPTGQLGQKSINVINTLKEEYAEVEIKVLNINTLWNEIAALPDATLQRLFPEPLETRSKKRINFPGGILKDDLFIGREEDMDRLSLMLQEHKRAYLTGVPGCGKSYVAIQYAFRKIENYSCLIWLNADTLETLRHSYDAVASRLGLPITDDKGKNIAVTSVHNYLYGHPDWLCIFDNADTFGIIDQSTPDNEAGTILVTSKTGTIGNPENRIDLSSMTEKDGATLLLVRAERLANASPLTMADSVDYQAAINIYREFDGLALALDQAGMFMKESPETPANYYERYKSEKEKQGFLEHRGDNPSGHPYSVWHTFQDAFSKLRSGGIAGEGAIELLKYCSLLAPDNIPEIIFTEGSAFLTAPLKKSANNAGSWDAILRATKRLSLIRRDGDNKFLSMHRITRDVMQSMLGKDSLKYAEGAVKAITQVFPEIEFSLNPVSDLLFPHVLECLNNIERLRSNTKRRTAPSIETGGLYLKIGYHIRKRGDYVVAEPFSAKAVKIFEKHSNADRYLVEATECLAVLYNNQGRYNDAIQIVSRIESNLKSLEGRDVLLVARCRDVVANAYKSLADVAKQQEDFPLFTHNIESAKKYARLSYEELEKAVQSGSITEKDSQVAWNAHSLAELYFRLGDLPNAETYCQSARQIREKYLPSDDTHLAWSYDLR